jgi:outer membrane protein OmpA-like peptidoglycan-associated protein
MMKTLYVASALAVAVAIVPACASKKFVRAEVGGVNTKVGTLSTSLEATQGRTRQNEARIGEVETKADAAARSADKAHAAAETASVSARAVSTQLGAVGARVDAVAATVATTRRLVYEVTLTEDQGNFTSGHASLPDAAKASLDVMVDRLKAELTGAFIEVEGHTDHIGGAAYNERLGLERADAVKRYLHEQHQVPLHKINVISYGETRPVAKNDTREGRAQNRRVVVRVLS